MGILDAMLGNAGAVNAEKVRAEYARILSEGEQIEMGYQVFRDLFLFTNRRLILVDKQGLTGSKVSYHSIPYRAVTHFSVETAGHFDLDAELKIWVAGAAAPLQKQFKKGVDVYEMQALLAKYVCR